ncbi:hypothetical protein GNI_036900, partial [Gregarina niphandrodes]
TDECTSVVRRQVSLSVSQEGGNVLNKVSVEGPVVGSPVSVGRIIAGGEGVVYGMLFAMLQVTHETGILQGAPFSFPVTLSLLFGIMEGHAPQHCHRPNLTTLQCLQQRGLGRGGLRRGLGRSLCLDQSPNSFRVPELAYVCGYPSSCFMSATGALFADRRHSSSFMETSLLVDRSSHSDGFVLYGGISDQCGKSASGFVVSLLFSRTLGAFSTRMSRSSSRPVCSNSGSFKPCTNTQEPCVPMVSSPNNAS